MKESLIKKEVTVPEATYWFHKIIAFHCYVIRMRQELYILSHTGSVSQTPVLFNMPRNTAVQQKGLSAVLIRISGLYHNPEMFHFRFINRLPISEPLYRNTEL
jgi:hypothetical protein